MSIVLLSYCICWILIIQKISNVFASTPEALEYALNVCGKVHITVSPLKDNYLELNWVTKNCTSYTIPDYIILTNRNVRDGDDDTFSSTLASVRTMDHPGGYFRTRIKYHQPWLPGNWEYHLNGLNNNNNNKVRADEGGHCLPYWIASIKSNKIFDSQCLAIQPTWMNDNRQYLGRRKIGNLFIPGTHNSGSYRGIISYFEGYVLNQDQSVWNQLVFGIRYLDLRVGYIPETGFNIYHDHVKITKIEPILEQIRRFAEMAPQEIIFVDFHRFPFPANFTKALHNRFSEIVHAYLGIFAVSPSGLQAGSGPTLNEIWSQNKSIIISYADRSTVNHTPWLWHPIKQFWGDSNKLTTLKEYLLGAIYQHKSNTNPMWALMAELTPQPWDVILRKNNLRDLAQTANKEVTKWIRDEWFNEVNIVATDYFLGNDLIRVAIEGNKLNNF